MDRSLFIPKTPLGSDRYPNCIWVDGTDGAEGAGGAVQGAGIIRGEAWFQDLSMRQGAGMTSWLMLTIGCGYVKISPARTHLLRVRNWKREEPGVFR